MEVCAVFKSGSVSVYLHMCACVNGTVLYVCALMCTLCVTVYLCVWVCTCVHVCVGVYLCWCVLV